MATQNKPARPDSGKRPAAPVKPPTNSGKTPPAPIPEPPPRKSHLGLKIFFGLLLVMLFLGSGLWAAIYFKAIDPQQLATEYKLYNYPVIGKYFSRPLTNFAPVEPENLPFPEPAVAPTEPAAAMQPPLPDQPAPPTAAEVEKLAKQKQQEEAKRVSRLARLYGEMAPDAAAAILGQLDDDAVVSILAKMEEDQSAKVLAAMDPRRAARLTGQMLKGK